MTQVGQFTIFGTPLPEDSPVPAPTPVPTRTSRTLLLQTYKTLRRMVRLLHGEGIDVALLCAACHTKIDIYAQPGGQVMLVCDCSQRNVR